MNVPFVMDSSKLEPPSEALWDAARRGDAAVVSRLVTSGSVIADVRDSYGWTALMHSAFQGHVHLVKLLVEKFGADVNARDPINKRTSLIAAAIDGDLEILRVLSWEGATVDAQDEEGLTALHHATWRGRADIVRDLMWNGAAVDDVDRDGWTALAFAARFGHADIVQFLLQRGAQPNAPSASKRQTPLMHAALGGHLTIVQMLLACGVDAACTDVNGDSTVLMALRGDALLLDEGARLEMVRWLVDRGASPTTANNDGETPLGVAEEEGMTRIAAFLKLFQPLDSSNQQSMDNEAASDKERFFEAVTNGELNVVLELVDQFLHARDDHGRTPLLLSAMSDRFDVLKVCLSRGANVSPRDDATASSALHFAAGNGNLRAVKLLLSEGADSGMKDMNGFSPIDVAASKGHLDVVQELFAHGASIRNRSIDRRTILHHAASANAVDIVHFLLSQNDEVAPGVDVLDSNGFSSLHVAAQFGYLEVARLLIDAGTNVNVLSSSITMSDDAAEAVSDSTVESEVHETTRHESPLHLAADNGHDDVVKLLLQSQDVEIDIRNHLEQTPLLVAVSKSYTDIVVLLIQAGANIEASASSDGRTALLMAAMQGSEELVRTLLEFGAHVEVVSEFGETPIEIVESDDIRGVLQLYQSSQQFHELCFQVMNSTGEWNGGVDGSSISPDGVTVQSLAELGALVTSAYDLRFLTTIALQLLDQAEVSKLATTITSDIANALKIAFELILEKKLVYDNDACVFFRLALEQCVKRGIVTQSNYMRWKIESTKVNMESAEWVINLKRQVYENSWRIQTCVKNVEMLAQGMKEMHTMVLVNREGVYTCAKRIRALQEQLVSGKRAMTNVMTQMQAAIEANTHSIDHDRERMTNVETRLSQFQNHLDHNDSNIQSLASHLKNLQHAQIQSLERQQKHETLKHGFGMVASLVGFVFAPILKEVFDTVLDLSNPLEIVQSAFSDCDDIVSFLSDNVGSEALKPAVKGLLAKYNIGEDDFTTVLRQDIVMQHPELVDECEKRGKVVSLGTTDSDGLQKLMKDLDREESALQETMNQLDVYTKDPDLGSVDSAALPSTLAFPAATIESVPPPSYDSGTMVSAVSVPVSTRALSGESSGSKKTNPAEPLPEPTPIAQTMDPSVTQLDEENSRPPLTRSNNSRILVERSEQASPQSPLKVSTVDDAIKIPLDPSQFPYHEAVKSSRGDLGLFIDHVQQIDATKCDASASAELRVEVSSVIPRASLTASEYAYCLGFVEVGDLLESKMPENTLRHEVALAVSVDVEEDLAEFPYHYAVSASNGDVEECELLLEVVEEDNDPVDAQVHARIVRKESSPMCLTPVELACHLGYVDIVKHLLLKMRVKTVEKAVVLLHRARERAKAIRHE